MFSKAAACLIGIFFADLPTSMMAADLGNKDGTQWSPFLQWEITNSSWTGNPFDVHTTVVFTHQASGETRRTEMFFLGNKTWAFRFTATQTGGWSFVTNSKNEALQGHTGKATIRASTRANAHGFLRGFSGKWGWEGSESVFVPQLVMWDYITGSGSPKVFHQNPKLIDDKIKEFLVHHGFNGFHVPVIGGRWFNMDGPAKVQSGMKDPDLRTFEALELLISNTHQASGMVHIWPWGDHQRSQTPRSLSGGIGGAVDARLQRYIAARLGPLPGWSMGYGFDLDEWVKADQVKRWRDSLHRLMGWNHFLGGRPEGPNHGTDHTLDAAWNKGLDYSSYEHHRPTYDVYRAALQAVPDVPVMSEDRFRIRQNKYPQKDYSEELVRRGLYHSTLAGGVANIWGIHPSLSPGGAFPNKHWIKTYSVFFHGKSRFLPDMVTKNNLSSNPDTRVLRSGKTSSLVLYRESTATIQIDLSSMTKPSPVVAVDTKKPYAEIRLGNLKPELQTLKLPSTSDWVVAIGRFKPPVKTVRLTTPAQLSFTDIWKGPNLNGGHGAMWADVDDDGLPDLYLPLISKGTLPDLFLHNMGTGEFVEEGNRRGIADPDGGSHGAVWCDLDNDGDYDLINGTTFDDGSGIQNDVFRNNGNGMFTEIKPRAIESRREPTRAFISFDMDRDGDLDLFGVSNYQGSADPGNEMNEVYRNDGNFNFTSIESGDLYPAGQAGNTLLGMRESQSNCGYLGQNDPVLHFGLGVRTHVNLVIQFLDGTKATRSNLAFNQTVLINARNGK